MNDIQPNWIPDASTFGARLALVRWRMGWNVREAERECNVSQNTWGNWEEGALPRDLNGVVNRVVLRTQVAKYWLLTGEGSPEPTAPANERNSDYGSAVTGELVSLNAWRTRTAHSKAAH